MQSGEIAQTRSMRKCDKNVTLYVRGDQRVRVDPISSFGYVTDMAWRACIWNRGPRRRVEKRETENPDLDQSARCSALSSAHWLAPQGSDEHEP